MTSVPPCSTQESFTKFAKKTKLELSRLRGRAVRTGVLDSMSLGRFRFSPSAEVGWPSPDAAHLRCGGCWSGASVGLSVPFRENRKTTNRFSLRFGASDADSHAQRARQR